MSIMVATGKGASVGVLFKNAEAIEVLRTVDTLLVDKTGTLTEGKPKLVTVATTAGFEESEVLRLAASLERSSEHPLAAAIVAGAEARGIELMSIGTERRGSNSVSWRGRRAGNTDQGSCSCTLAMETTVSFFPRSIRRTPWVARPITRIPSTANRITLPWEVTIMI